MSDQFPYTHMALMGSRRMSPALLHILSKASNQLLAQARDIVGRDDEDYRLPLILAYAACDIQTEEALQELITCRKLDYLRDVLLKTNNGNLSNGRTQNVYEALSGDSPWSMVNNVRQSSWWDSWSDGYDKRNDVAHKDKQVTRGEAAAIVKACQEYVDHLIGVVGEIRTK